MAAGRTTVVEIRADLLEALRELYPARSDREILEGILREYLARCTSSDTLARSRRSDAEETDDMLRSLAVAPLDDESTSDAEDRSARDALAEYSSGAAVSSSRVKRDLGLS